MLGWQPKHSIVKDVDMEVKVYEKVGGMKEEWSTDKELKYDQEVCTTLCPWMIHLLIISEQISD